MIVIDIKKLEDFLTLLPKRLGNEIYFHLEQRMDKNEVVLHFLSKVEDTEILCLYQTTIKFSSKIKKEKIYTEMDDVFKEFSEIKLIQGRISELFFSLSCK